MRPVPYLRNENVQWNRFDLTDVSWMDFSEAEEEKFRLQPGDLLVCEGGEPGRAAVWEGQIERCCYQKALHRIRPRNEGLFPPFLMYRLWMSAMNGEFAGAQTQTTISHVPREKLLQLRMPLPPLTEQRRIAAELTRALEGVSTVQSVALSGSRRPNHFRRLSSSRCSTDQNGVGGKPAGSESLLGVTTKLSILATARVARRSLSDWNTSNLTVADELAQGQSTLGI